MPAPFFTTNDSDISQLEGLYIKERNPPAVISGVSLNSIGVAGTAIRGPVGRAVLIGSESRFREVYGWRDQGAGGAPTSNLWKALSNKPFGSLYVTRVAASAAAISDRTFGQGNTAWTNTVTCDTEGNSADGDWLAINDGVNPQLTFELDKVPNGVAVGHIPVDISGATTAQDVAVLVVAAINVKITAGLLNLNTVAAPIAGVITLVASVTGLIGDVGLSKSGHFTIAAGTNGTDTNIMKISASSPGIWGNGVTVSIQNATDGVTTHFNMVVTYLGVSVTYKNLNLAAGIDNSLSILGDDDGNYIVLTKIADGRPYNVSSYALGAGGGTVGTEGSVGDSDYTGSGKALDILANTPALGAVFVAEYMSSAVRSKMDTLAAVATDRLFLICADNASNTVADVTNTNNSDPSAGAHRSDRVVYCFNHPYTLDNDTATEMLTQPTSWMASILSQTDIDIHPGEEDTKQFTAGITRLYYPALARADYIALRAAGVAALEQDDGYAFVSGVTTSLVPGKEQITRRRMADFLQLSIAKTLKFSVKKKNTFTRKQANAGMVQQFLDDLQRAERVVLASNVDPDILNTPSQEAQGIVRMLVRVRLIGHILELVLETEIGTAVVVTQQQ